MPLPKDQACPLRSFALDLVGAGAANKGIARRTGVSNLAGNGAGVPVDDDTVRAGSTWAF